MGGAACDAHAAVKALRDAERGERRAEAITAVVRCATGASPSLLQALPNGPIEADDAACAKSARSAGGVTETIEIPGLNVERLRTARETVRSALRVRCSPFLDDRDAMREEAREVVDSRFAAGLRAGGLALIADNGAQGAFVLGAGTDDWRGLDLAARAELWMNGEKASEGSGANVLGHPLEPLAWLANARAARGHGLAAGEIVTTGSACAALGFAEAGDAAEALIAGLGAASAAFR